MTIRYGMIDSARKSMATLDESAGLVADYILGKLNSDGGFSGRSSHSDLYYTVFGIESLIAIGREVYEDAVADYLKSFDPEVLDLVHLGCLVRCMKDLQLAPDIDRIADRLTQYRTADGGFNNIKNSANGSMYGCFFATAIFQDLGIEIAAKQGIMDCIDSLTIDDGSFANDTAMNRGTTPSTAAAITLKYYLSGEQSPRSIDWLLSQMHPNGGFASIPGAPIADLLSTATALHALSLASVRLNDVDTEKCLDFIDSLWSGKGGFCGSLADQAADCEYTFYGLLSIGHLS